jgi:D-proline reductase (dithiol) PrdB
MYKLRKHRSFVSYIDRSREYYAAQGYDKPYEWPHYDSAPFTPLAKPLARTRVGLVTTGEKPKSSGAVTLEILLQRDAYAEASNPPPQSLSTDLLFWDKAATHTKDIGSFLPINQLNEAVAAGRVGSASARYYGIPTDYSKSRTLDSHAPRILQWCREDEVEAVILTAL